MEILNNLGKYEFGELEFKYVVNMYGDEVIGWEMLFYFIKYLCKNYGVNCRVINIIDMMRIYILLSMNFDGYEMVVIYFDDWWKLSCINVNGVDLNWNFFD